MLKKKLGTIATPLALALFLVPAASQAAPVGMPALLDKLVRWWETTVEVSRPRVPVRHTAVPKNGCGIDPQGNPLCGTGLVTPPPTDPLAGGDK